MKWLKDRSTGEILVLLIAVTICGYLITVSVTTIIFTFIHPDKDTTAAFRSVTNIINTLTGLLAGYLAGKTDTWTSNKKKEDQPP